MFDCSGQEMSSIDDSPPPLPTCPPPTEEEEAAQQCPDSTAVSASAANVKHNATDDNAMCQDGEDDEDLSANFK